MEKTSINYSSIILPKNTNKNDPLIYSDSLKTIYNNQNEGYLFSGTATKINKFFQKLTDEAMEKCRNEFNRNLENKLAEEAKEELRRLKYKYSKECSGEMYRGMCEFSKNKLHKETLEKYKNELIEEFEKELYFPHVTVKGFKNIKMLKITKYISSLHIQNLLYLKGLKTLDLSETVGLSRQNLISILNRCPDLKYFKAPIQYSTKINNGIYANSQIKQLKSHLECRGYSNSKTAKAKECKNYSIIQTKTNNTNQPLRSLTIIIPNPQQTISIKTQQNKNSNFFSKKIKTKKKTEDSPYNPVSLF